VPAGVGVRGGVAVWRVVAASDVTALQADPQVKPGLTRGQALFATGNLFGKLGELDVVAVLAEHPFTSVTAIAFADIAQTCRLVWTQRTRSQATLASARRHAQCTEVILPRGAAEFVERRSCLFCSNEQRPD
jgi:hypothetical protein